MAFSQSKLNRGIRAACIAASVVATGLALQACAYRPTPESIAAVKKLETDGVTLAGFAGLKYTGQLTECSVSVHAIQNSQGAFRFEETPKPPKGHAGFPAPKLGSDEKFLELCIVPDSYRKSFRASAWNWRSFGSLNSGELFILTAKASTAWIEHLRVQAAQYRNAAYVRAVDPESSRRLMMSFPGLFTAMGDAELSTAVSVQRLDVARSIQRQGKSFAPDTLARLRELTLQQGAFADVMAYAESGDRDAIKRALGLANGDSERRLAEMALVRSIQDKLITLKASLQGTGKTSASDRDALIARIIENVVSSRVDWSATVEREIYEPQYDIKVNAKLVLTVRGLLNGVRYCGFFGMSKCEVKDQEMNKTYEYPLMFELRRGQAFITKGTTQIDWKSVSGGSGPASGFMLWGGSSIFAATDVALGFSIRSLEVTQ